MRPGGFGDLVILHALVHVLHQAVQPGKHPFVHQRQVLFPGLLGGGLIVVDGGVQGEEGIRVPQGAHELALHVAYQLAGEPGGQPGSGGGVEIPAHRVRALLVQHVPGIDHVADVLAHLPALGVLHVPQHDAVFKGRPVEQQGGDGHQGVEPASGLVDGLGNEVGGEFLLETAPDFQRDSATGQRAWTRNRTSSRSPRGSAAHFARRISGQVMTTRSM